MNDPQQYQDYGNTPSVQNSQYYSPYVVLRNTVPQCYQTPLYMQPPLPPANYCQMFLHQQMPAHLPEAPASESVPQPTYPVNNVRSEPRKTNILKIVDPDTKERISLPKEAVQSICVSVSERNNTHAPRPLIVSDPPSKVATIKEQPGSIPNVAAVSDVQQTSTDLEKLYANEDTSNVEKHGSISSEVSIAASEGEQHDLGESEVEEELEPSSELDSSQNVSDAVSSRSSVKSAEDDGDRILKYDRARLLELRKLSETTVPPLKQSSISINQNDRLRNNYRRERQRRCLTLKTDVKLDDVDNAYKPAHLRQTEAEGDDRENYITRSLNLVLNRLLDDNIPEIVAEIRKLSISGPDEMQCLVKILTAKATRQTKYSKVFAKLCVELSKNKFDKFKMSLVSAVNKLFETPLEKHIEEVNANIDAKISETSDEKVKKMLEEDRETAVSKRRESFLGIIQFFSQLFIEKLIPDKSASESLKTFSKPKSQDDILALLTCLNVCGSVLEHRIPNLLKECITGLEAAKRDLKLEQHVSYKITEIIELRNRQWIALEPIAPIPPSTQRTSDYRRDTPNRNTQQHATRKFDSQGALNVPSLALSGTRSVQNEKFLGPRKDWTKGSSSNQISSRNPQHGRFNLFTQMGSGANSESESAKDNFQPSSSNRKHKNVPTKKENISDKIDVPDAISEAVEAFTISDTPSYDLVVLDAEKAIFIEQLLNKFIDESTQDRKIASDIISHIYRKSQLTSKHILQGYGAFLENCDEDFLIDCPKGDHYISEYLTALLFDTTENLDLLVEMLENLPENRRSPMLARCLHHSSKTIGEEVVSNIFARSSINWPSFTGPSFKDFAKEHGIEFLKSSKLSASASNDSLSKQDEFGSAEVEKFFLSKKTDFDSLKNYFTKLSNKNPQPTKNSTEFLSLFLQNCSKQERKLADSYVQILATLVDLSSDCDKSLLHTLCSAKLPGDYCKTLLRLFLQFKVINKDSLMTFSNDPQIRKDFRNCSRDVLEIKR